MTGIEDGKTFTRETQGKDRGRNLVVELHARYLAIRAKGTREWYPVSYEAVYDLARKINFRRVRSAGAAIDAEVEDR